MSYLNEQQTNTGSFVPTTNIWDVSDLKNLNVNSDEFKELLVRLYQNINQIALVLNTKVSGYAIDQEFVTGGLFMDPSDPSNLRTVYRKVINMGQLAPSSTNTVAHGITTSATFIFVSPLCGVASKTTATRSYIPIPYVDTTAANCAQLIVNATNVIIKAGTIPATYDTCFVTLEYVY